MKDNKGIEQWLRYFGMPEENIEKCATQIAQGYGACRYLDGVNDGAKAVDELGKETSTEKCIPMPLYILKNVYDTLRIHRNCMIEGKQTNSCLWRMTNQSMNYLSCYMKGKAADKNLDRIVFAYNSGNLLNFDY